MGYARSVVTRSVKLWQERNEAADSVATFEARLHVLKGAVHDGIVVV